MRKGCVLLGLLCVVTASVRPTAAETPCEVAEQAIRSAEKIRGLSRKRKVPCFIHDENQIRKYLLSALETKLPAQKIENEGTLLRALGLLPDDFDYRDGLVRLYLSQLGGYYEPAEDHFVMAKAIPAEMQQHIAVHELTHALQDQFYDMEKFIDLKAADTDPVMARSALAEGDATAVMYDYLRRLQGQRPLSKETDIESFLVQNVLSMSFGAPENTPLSLRLLVVFPYVSGLRFVHTILQKDGYKGLDRVFRNPPRSTEEILHPSKYGKDPDFQPISRNEVLPAEWASVLQDMYTDVFGEFMVSIFAEQQTGDKVGAAKAAEGWGGDRISIFRLPEGTPERAADLRLPVGTRWSYLVGWRIRWDSQGDADEFSAALSKKEPLPEEEFKSLREGKAWRVLKFPKETLILVALGEGLPRLDELKG